MVFINKNNLLFLKIKIRSFSISEVLYSVYVMSSFKIVDSVDPIAGLNIKKHTADLADT